MINDLSTAKMAKQQLHFVLEDQGMGDDIGRLVAIDYAAKNYPWIIPHAWVKDFMFEIATELLDKSVQIHKLSDINSWTKPALTKLGKNQIHTTLRTHTVDQAFHNYIDYHPEMNEKNYLQFQNFVDVSDFNLPKKYFVITTGFTSKSREFNPIVVNKIADYLLASGIMPVFLGSQNAHLGQNQELITSFQENIHYYKGINLINKTNLSQAASIIHSSMGIVGLDNGLLHLAGCTKTPIIAGYTTVDPKYRMPIRNNRLGHNVYTVVPDKNIDCKFCQCRLNFVYGADFRDCYFKNFACTQEDTSERYISHIKTILSNHNTHLSHYATCI